MIRFWDPQEEVGACGYIEVKVEVWVLRLGVFRFRIVHSGFVALGFGIRFRVWGLGFGYVGFGAYCVAEGLD